MAKYYYNKYNTSLTHTEGTWSYKVRASNLEGSYTSLKTTVLYGTHYTFSPTEGYKLTGNLTRRYKGALPVRGSYYLGSLTETPSLSIFKITSNTSEEYAPHTTGETWRRAYYVDQTTANRVYSRSSLVQSNRVAENGTYPNNGRHTDGYWYVRGSIIKPSTPSSITVPSEIKGGESISISWGGGGTYADSYRLEIQLDSGAWVLVYSGSNSSYVDIVPKGTSTVNYRVRSYGNTQYSSYRTGSTRTVKNFPEMGIRINSVLKTSDNGWVKVNGVLKEIDSMWVRINGTLKEV